MTENYSQSFPKRCQRKLCRQSPAGPFGSAGRDLVSGLGLGLDFPDDVESGEGADDTACYGHGHAADVYPGGHAYRIGVHYIDAFA